MSKCSRSEGAILSLLAILILVAGLSAQQQQKSDVRPIIYPITVVEKAQDENFAADTKDKVKRAKKLLKEKEKLDRRLAEVNAELQQLNSVPAGLGKNYVNEKERPAPVVAAPAEEKK